MTSKQNNNLHFPLRPPKQDDEKNEDDDDLDIDDI